MHRQGSEKTNEPFQRQMGEGVLALVAAAAAVIVIYGLQQARTVIVPVLMAAFLAIISYYVTGLLRKYLRFPHWLAVTSTVAVDFGVIFGVICLINYLAADMKEALQGDVMSQFAQKYNDAMVWLDGMGWGDQARALASSPQELFNPQLIISFTQTITGQVLSLLSTCTLVLIMMTFFMGEGPLFHRNLNRLPSSALGKKKIVDALTGIQRYLFIKTVSSAATGILVWGMCCLMNVPFSFLWGVCAFVLNYIPTIGSIVAAIPPILLMLLLASWSDALIVALGYLGINFAIGNGIEPLFLGKQFGIATSLVLLSVLFWGWVLGPCGMFLAVPITVLIKLGLENSEDLYWVAMLIDDQHSEKITKH